MLPQANPRLKVLSPQANIYSIFANIDYDKQTKHAILYVYLLFIGEP